MLKYLRNRRSKSGVKKSKLNKDDFNLVKTVAHGFPRSPTCLAVDEKLSLLAIGTKKGSLRVYGKPGVELEATIDNNVGILSICFVPNKGQLVVLSDDYLLTLWEINVKQLPNGAKQSFLEPIKTCDVFIKEDISSDLKQVTTLTITSNNEKSMVGSKVGNVYMISLDGFELTEEVIYATVVQHSVPSDFKKTSLGEVEAILEKPFEPHKLLIGYSRGVLVLWDTVNLVAENFYISDQELQSAYWRIDGEQFVSSHNDGSYICWKVNLCLDDSKHVEQPYGPYPCKSIPKIVTKKTKENDEYYIFSGGLLRHSFPDKNSVSIFKKGTDDCIKDQVLDFPSKVIDFVVIDSERDEKATFDIPNALIVLTEEELVAFDLNSPDWLQYPLPYLSGIHSSPITCSQYYSNIPEQLFAKISDAGVKQQANKYSLAPWPINGGEIVSKSYTPTNDLLITGHEDGSVRFWNSGDVDLKHIYTLKTQKLFASPDDDIIAIDSDDVPLSSDGKEEAWPPFRKVGNFDPYSDDPQLSIRKILFCVSSGTLIVGGAAGQVMIFSPSQEESEEKFFTQTIHIMSESDAANIKGLHKLNVKSANVKYLGFETVALLQASPPAAVTALAFNYEWNLLAIGTSFGFGLYDFVQHCEVLMKCTLSSQESAAVASGDALISRRKSFKKSLRESFRRLKRGRSLRGGRKSEGTTSSSPSGTPSSSPNKGLQSPTKELSSSDLKPIERRVEPRSTDDFSAAVVKCLHFGMACIDKKETAQTVTLWAGTQAGIVYALAFNVPGLEAKEESPDARKTESVTYLSGREIRLAHKAPVIFISLIDSAGHPIPDPCEAKNVTKKSAAVVDKVLICTEEQFILYSIPQLKHHSKYKLTADEGLRARKIALIPFTSKLDENISEYFIVCLSNHGDVEIFSLSDFEQRLKTSLTKKEDIQAISSLLFTQDAEGLYLHSPSELRRFSLSPCRIVESIYLINLPPDARPVKIKESVPSQEEQSSTGAVVTAVAATVAAAVAAGAGNVTTEVTLVKEGGVEEQEEKQKQEEGEEEEEGQGPGFVRGEGDGEVGDKIEVTVEKNEEKSEIRLGEVKSDQTDEKKEVKVEKSAEKSKGKGGKKKKKTAQQKGVQQIKKEVGEALDHGQDGQMVVSEDSVSGDIKNENMTNKDVSEKVNEVKEGIKQQGQDESLLVDEMKELKINSINGVAKEELNESLEVSHNADLTINTTIDSVRDLTLTNSMDKSETDKMKGQEVNPVLNSHED